MNRHTEVSDESSVLPADRLLIAVNNPDTVGTLVSLALLLRRPRCASPLIALNVVLEDDPSARQSGLTQLQRAEKMAAAAHVRMQSYSRWSVNVVSGISHTVKENAVSDLVVGLHQKEKLVDAFFGKLGTDLLASVERQIFIYRGTIPLNTVRRLHVLIPRKAQFEPGFSGWVERLALLARQLSCPVDVYSGKETLQALRHYGETHGSRIDPRYHDFVSWSDLLPLAHAVRQDEMAVFVCARRGTISFQNYLDRLPVQIERYFSMRNILFVYPAQKSVRL